MVGCAAILPLEISRAFTANDVLHPLGLYPLSLKYSDNLSVSRIAGPSIVLVLVGVWLLLTGWLLRAPLPHGRAHVFAAGALGLVLELGPFVVAHVLTDPRPHILLSVFVLVATVAILAVVMAFCAQAWLRGREGVGIMSPAPADSM